MQEEYLFALFRSVMEEDKSPIVLCDLNHTIVYMNPAAQRNYSRYGGQTLLGKNLLACHSEMSAQRIAAVLAWFQNDKNNQRVHTFYSEKENTDVYMVALRADDGTLIGYYEKHECRDPDTAPFYTLG